MLTIANFQADYHLPKGTPDASAAQKRFDRLIRGALAENIAQHLRPSAEDTEAVYRIRHLETELWADLNGTTDAELARLWAQLLIRSLVQALLMGQPNTVVRYESHAHFVAAFLGDVLIGQAWSRWMYEEFAPLRDLPEGRVAVYILAAKPELLIPVAAQLARNRHLDRLIQALTAQDAKLLWQKAVRPHEPPSWHRLEGATLSLLDLLRSVAVIERGELLWRNALRLYLSTMLAQTVNREGGLLSGLCYHLALLNQLWSAYPSPVLWQALAAAEIGSIEALAPMLRTLDSSLAGLRDWLAAVIASDIGRAYLAHLVPIVAPSMLSRVLEHTVTSSDVTSSTMTPKDATSSTMPPSDVTSSAVRRGSTAFAGLGLLLSLFRKLELFKLVGQHGIYQLLVAAVGTTLRPLARSEEAVAWLAGIPYEMREVARSTNIDWAIVADKLAVGRESDIIADDLVCKIADHLLQQFGLGIRGFEQSSPIYLREQFINLPGQIHITDDQIDVHFSSAPLGIVLQMAGRDGEQGPIPWLEDRLLWIHL